jgi:hypothetical protein
VWLRKRVRQVVLDWPLLAASFGEAWPSRFAIEAHPAYPETIRDG